MSIARCKKCGIAWDAALQPDCPQCLPDRWMRTPGFLRKKHDPRSLSSPYSRDRSIMSSEYMGGSPDFLSHAASQGTACYSPRHHDYCYLASSPGSAVAGSVVPAGGTVATQAFHGVVVAQPWGSAHIYTEDLTKMQQEYAAGRYIPLPRCAVGGCSKLAIPEDGRCVVHTSPALAD
jgi:hypothetical protein